MGSSTKSTQADLRRRRLNWFTSSLNWLEAGQTGSNSWSRLRGLLLNATLLCILVAYTKGLLCCTGFPRAASWGRSRHGSLALTRSQGAARPRRRGDMQRGIPILRSARLPTWTRAHTLAHPCMRQKQRSLRDPPAHDCQLFVCWRPAAHAHTK